MVINRYCGSGIEAIHIACARIHAGQADVIIAGGTESMSLVPVMGWRTALNYTIAKDHPDYYTSMGLTAEAVAKKYNVSREDQDKFAFESHRKAAAAIREGKFKYEIVPIHVKEVYVDDNKKKTREFVVDTDEGVRADTTLDALA